MQWAKLKQSKKLKAVGAVLACGLVLTAGGQAEAAEGETLYGAQPYSRKPIEGVTNNSASASVNKTSSMGTYGELTGVADAVSRYVDYTVASGTWDFVYGGYYWEDNEMVLVTDNTVTIEGGTVGVVIGGMSKLKNVCNNTVIITGETITQDVYGGYTFGTGKDRVPVMNNTVIVAGGKVKGSVYGGFCINSGLDSPIISENTVTLGNENNTAGHADIDGCVTLNAYGRENPQFGGTLNIYNTDNSVGDTLNAPGANINFYINPADMDTDGLKTMLTVGIANISRATINAGVREVNGIAKGNKITLLTATETLNADTKLSTGKLTDGIMQVDLAIVRVGNSLIATAASGAEVDDGPGSAAKSPVETMAASVSLLNSGADMLAKEGMDSAAQTAAASAAEGSSTKMAPFATFGGNKMKYETGSYVDMNSWNAALGFAKEVSNSRGSFMFAPVIEYGRGSYDSYLDNGTHGDGKSRFTGVGIMAKQSNKDGIYYEGSLRAGRTKSDYKSNFVGVPVSYDTSAPYYALHLGVGKVIDLNDTDSLDYYGKLFYSHQNGDRAHLDNGGSGYDYDFKAVNSVRTRLGLRYSHKLNATGTIYTGLAWQHEFDSKCRATIHSGTTSVEAPAPGIKGDSGILELGWKIKPNKGAFETGLGFTGSIGKQKGVGVSAELRWNF